MEKPYKRHAICGSLGVLVCLSACSPSPADTNPTELHPATNSPMPSGHGEQVIETQLAEGLFFLSGPGGNVAMSVGEDGVLIVDDKFERVASEIIQIANRVGNGNIRLVLNTHHHGDHSGGNGILADSGAIVVAHDNARYLMGQTKQNTILNRVDKPAPVENWPVVTYSENASFHFNSQSVKAFHVPNAHTTGDVIIVFEGSNAIHMGDNYYNGRLPFVDVDGGGTLQGMIAAQKLALEKSRPETIIIPGHGPIATPQQLSESVEMLERILAIVEGQIETGSTVEEIIAKGIPAEYRHLESFIDEEKMVRIAYRSLVEE